MASGPAIAGRTNDEPPESARLEGPLLGQWLVLSQYDRNWTGQYSSKIVNPDFFVSPKGRIDPFAEFSAFETLTVAYAEHGEYRETLCRFPARLRLFKQHNLLPRDWRDPACPEFERINQPDAIRSVSLVFASGYFDSPSSYYGHILLKFNYDGSSRNQRALDSSLNYGADATDNPSGPLYVIKGLLGGYTASYTRNNHFLHTYLYTNAQLRDTWEYELNLTAEQVQFLVAHSWEMLFARFQYYFFNDNCAHRIAKLIEVTTGRDLSDTHGFWLLPTQVVRSLRTEGSSDSFVTSEKYNPSLKSTFSAHLALLDSDQKQEFVDLFTLDQPQKAQAVRVANAELLQLMLDYLDLEVAKTTLAKEDEASLRDLQVQRALILSEMFRRPAGSIRLTSPDLSRPQSPSEMKPPSVLRIGSGVRDGRSFQTLSYRAANNDLLNMPSPGQEASRFIMVELGIEIERGSVDLRKLVVFDVLNLNTNPLPTSMTHERSWSLTLDYAPRNRLCTDCSNFGLEARLGRSVRSSARLLFYGFVGGRVHTRDSDTDDYLELSTELGSVISVTERSIFKVSAEAYHDVLLGNTNWHGQADLSFTLTRNSELRLSFEKNRKDEVVLATLGYYFD